MSDNHIDTGTSVATQADVQSTEVATERPSWLPEGFTSGEDLASAYAELERQQQEVTSPVHDAAIPANHSDAQALVDAAGLAFDKLNDEFVQNSTLSARSYADLARAGISRDVVDGYIAGQQAVAHNIRNEVFSAAGGSEAFEEMTSWAASNFDANQIDGFNAVMNSGDPFQMKLAVDGLKARFVAENGSAPKLIGGYSGHGDQSHGDGFATTKELTAAMKDPRYASDSAYRSDVMAKLARSSIM